MNQEYNNSADLLNIISIFLALQNLQENREQSEHNDVQSATDNQTQFLIKKLEEKFAEQTVILNQILKTLEKLSNIDEKENL